MNTVTTISMAQQLAPHTRGRRAAREQAVAVAAASRRNDLAPALALEERALAELKPARRKVRTLDPAHVAGIARSIAALGFSVPLLIAGDGTLVDGHARLEAARGLGMTALPCIVVDHLSDAELAALKIAVNRHGETGGWDVDALALDLQLLTEVELDLEVTGFSLPEIDILLSLGDEEAASSEEEPLPSDGPPVSRLGDLWQLGAHRLFVGDATKPESYAALMQGELAAAVFTDPPYNIPIAGFVSPKGKHEDFAMGVGEMSDGDFQAFLATVLGHAKAATSAGAVLFGCMDWRNLHLLTLAGKEVGLSHINTAIWSKGVGGMGGLYRSAHEMIAVFVNGTKPACNNVELGKHGRDRTNVWGYPGSNRQGSSANKLLGQHPTPKPTELVRDALLDVTRRGDLVLDPFLGSGTTIVAAEACGRIGYGMELDTTYADLIVRRWQAATGKEATLAGDGATFQQITCDRVQAKLAASKL